MNNLLRRTTAFFLLLLGTAQVSAQIVLDGSVGPAGAVLGPDYQLGAELGQLQGQNLFHSFSSFTLQAGESAHFSGPASVLHVISRVTGGNPSEINGTLRSSLAAADFYFLNPNGVLFGDQAKIEVPGGFHVSTADTLRLGDGGEFNARFPEQSLLRSAPPEAFGFLGNAPASIQAHNSSLAVAGGQNLSLIGGQIHISGEAMTPGENGQGPTFHSEILAPGGQILLVAVAAPGEVSMLGEPSAPAQGAAIDLTNTLALVSAPTAGNIVLLGGDITLSSSMLQGETTVGPGGRLRVQADNLTLQGQDDLSSRMLFFTVGSGRGGNISLMINDTLLLTDRAEVRSDSQGLAANAGQAGDMSIQAGQVIVRGLSSVTTSTLGAGDGGRLSVTAQRLEVSGGQAMGEGSNVASFTVGQIANAGDAGSVDINVGELVLRNGGEIGTQTESTGNGGSVVIQADSIQISGGQFSSAIVAESRLDRDPTLAGNAGSLTITTGELRMEGLSKISTETRGAGRGGIVTINADHIQLASAIVAESFAGGDAGSIILTTQSLQMEKTSKISTESRGSGDGGQIIIVAEQILLESAIIAESFGSGDAGSITIDAGRLEILPTGKIDTSTRSTGAGGNIRLTVTDFLATGSGVQGEPGSSPVSANIVPTGIFVNSTNAAPNAGNAGSIFFLAERLHLRDGAEIASSAERAGGGNLTLSLGDLLLVEQGRIITSVRQGIDNGGNIEINSGQFVVLNQGRIAADADAGRGGNIEIQAKTFLPSTDSVISASSRLGIDGRININAPNENTLGNLSVLSSAFLDVGALYREACKAENDPEASRFQVDLEPEGIPRPARAWLE